MSLRRWNALSWSLECELRSRDILIGVDGSVVLTHEKVFVLRPDDLGESTRSLWGRIEYVWHLNSIDPIRRQVKGMMAYDARSFFVEDVISCVRGPCLRAVRRLQRAFRRRLYFKWFHEMGGWAGFVKDIVAFAECRGRVLRKSTIDPFCPGPAWGYVLDPAVARISGPLRWTGRPPWEGFPICVPALGTRRLCEVQIRNGRVRRPEQLYAMVGGQRHFVGTIGDEEVQLQKPS